MRSASPSWRWLLRDAAVAMSVATLLHLRQIAAWTDERNRYLWQWDRLDAPAELASILAVALLLVTAATGVRRLGRPIPTRIAAHAFVVITGFALASFLPRVQQLSFRAELAALVVVSVAGISYGAGSLMLPRWLYRLGLVFAPLPLILAVQLLGWSTWRGDDEPLPPSPPTIEATTTPKSPGPPVVLVVFDEWSYPRSFAGGDPIAALPQLRQLATHSMVFHAARAPGEETSVSLPKIATMLGAFHAAGYRTRLLGFYLPYRAIVGDSVDFVRSYPHDPKGEDLPTRVAGLALYNVAQHLADPFSRRIGPGWYRRAFSQYWLTMVRRFESDLASLLDSAGPGTFTLVHAPIPHCPFIFDGDGRYKGPYAGERWLGSPEEYEQHLRYMDRTLGGIVAHPGVDRALLVLTSDHSWRHDPDTRLRASSTLLRHVPLLARWPDQQQRLDVRREVAVESIAPLLLRPNAEAAAAAL